MIVKCNMTEANKAFGENDSKQINAVGEIGTQLLYRTKKLVFLTRGEKGILVIDENEEKFEIPALKIIGPIDIVGAGDSVMAAISASISTGANLKEAATIGVIAASIIIQQIGTTGTVTREQILSRYREYFL